MVIRPDLLGPLILLGHGILLGLMGRGKLVGRLLGQGNVLGHLLGQGILLGGLLGLLGLPLPLGVRVRGCCCGGHTPLLLLGLLVGSTLWLWWG